MYRLVNCSVMTRLIQIPFILCLAIFTLVLSSCGSIDKLVESGNYEEAVRLAQNRLTGKQKKNPKYVLALETAFNQVTASDMERARRKAELEGIVGQITQSNGKAV